MAGRMPGRGRGGTGERIIVRSLETGRMPWGGIRGGGYRREDYGYIVINCEDIVAGGGRGGSIGGRTIVR